MQITAVSGITFLATDDAREGIGAAMSAFIAYQRVSTTRQGQSGLGLEAQQAAIARHVGNGTLLATYTEVESGKRDDRPQLDAALRRCRETGATLVVAKLDRLARDVAFIANLMKAGVDFVACDTPHATRLTIHILAAVAEDEARRISERTKAALAAAKARGVALGGFRGVAPTDEARRAAAAVRGQKATQHAARMRAAIDGLDASERASLGTIAAALNAKGLTTPRGCQWTPMQVSRVLARSAA